jgi:hypothetical protein
MLQVHDCPAHIPWCELENLWTTSLCNFLPIPILDSLLGSNKCSTLFSVTKCHPYQPRGKIIGVCFYFHVVCKRWENKISIEMYLWHIIRNDSNVSRLKVWKLRKYSKIWGCYDDYCLLGCNIWSRRILHCSVGMCCLHIQAKVLHCCTLKVEVAGSSKMLITFYLNEQHYIQKVSNLREIVIFNMLKLFLQLSVLEASLKLSFWIY